MCFNHAQESSAAANGNGVHTDMQSSHLDIPMSAGLALNPPSHGQMQMQNGDVAGRRRSFAALARAYDSHPILHARGKVSEMCPMVVGMATVSQAGRATDYAELQLQCWAL